MILGRSGESLKRRLVPGCIWNGGGGPPADLVSRYKSEGLAVAVVADGPSWKNELLGLRDPEI